MAEGPSAVTTVTPFPGNADHVVISNMPYRRTNRIRWTAAGPVAGFNALADTLEQCYVCLQTGPDVWLPVTREPPDAA
jgi:hypothetical protein